MSAAAHTQTPIGRHICDICHHRRETASDGSLTLTSFPFGHTLVVVGIDLHPETHGFAFRPVDGRRLLLLLDTSLVGRVFRGYTIRHPQTFGKSLRLLHGHGRAGTVEIFYNVGHRSPDGHGENKQKGYNS